MTKDQKTKLIVEEYVQLARKLNKLPSRKDVHAFLGYSRDMIRYYFSNITNLQKEAQTKYPDLEQMTMPAVLMMKDVENFRLKTEAQKRNKSNVSLVKSVNTLDYVAKFAEKVFSGKVSPSDLHKEKAKKIRLKRALNLTLSDLHFGSDIKAEETGYLDYGTIEESRRFAAIIEQTIAYKTEYRDHTELHVNLLGDIIQNKLHDPIDAATISEQSCRAIHLLTQGFAVLAESFPKVTVHCASGNHGRNTARHHDRATSGKWDSIETIIYYAVKSALTKYDNLVFDIPKTPFCVYEVLGNKVFATHGDTVLNPGNPGKSINIGRLEQQINRINASMTDNDEVKVAIVGHTHCASVSQLASGAHLITNGCLPPVDPFAVSIGILENRGSQTIFEMTPKFALGDIRFIQIGPEQDTNKALNKLIKPWESF